MPFFYSAVITGARKLVNDSTVPYRASDADMLGWLKEGVNESVLLRPDLFAEKGTHLCVAGSEQLLVHDRALYLVGVIGIAGGDIVEECDYHTLRQFFPGFRQFTPGPAENWMRHPDDVNRRQSIRFMVTPPSLAGQSLEVLWSEAPDVSGITTVNMNIAPVANAFVEMSDAYFTAYQHFVAYKHESTNDEAPNIARAEQHYKQFVALMGANQAVAPRE